MLRQIAIKIARILETDKAGGVTAGLHVDLVAVHHRFCRLAIGAQHGLVVGEGRDSHARPFRQDDAAVDREVGGNGDDEDIAPEPEPVIVPPANDTPPDEQQTEDIQKDLRKWRIKAIKLLKDGKSAAVQFESNTIPDSLVGSILGALEGAKTQIDINRIFHNAMTWKGYP